MKRANRRAAQATQSSEQHSLQSPARSAGQTDYRRRAAAAKTESIPMTPQLSSLFLIARVFPQNSLFVFVDHAHHAAASREH